MYVCHFHFFPRAEHLGSPQERRGYVAALRTCGPFFDFIPVLSIADPPNGTAYAALLPTCHF